MISTKTPIMSDSSSRKKYKHLTVLQRLEIVKKLRENVSPKSLAEEFGVTVHTVYNIKRNAASLLKDVANKHHLHHKTKKIKGPVLRELDDKLYHWFSEQSATGNMINDKHLQQKAEEINTNSGGPSTFACNRAWVWRFKKRHGIHTVQMGSEITDADFEEADQFSATFWKYVEDENLSLSNVYNMDETGLMWKSLPRKNLVPSVVETVSGEKMEKERITIGFCANVTGTHKLLPLLVHNCKKLKAMRNDKALKVTYAAQKSAWMNRKIFRDWYENNFKPAVRAQHLRTGEVGKVLLLVDNCSAHILPPDAAKDDDFELMYLPPDATSAIQPMCQGVINEVKLRFRLKLAEKLLGYPDGLAQFDKQYDLRDSMDILNTCWEQVTEQSIRNSWKQVLGDNSEEIEAETGHNFENPSIAEILQNCPETAVTQKEVEEWLASCQTEEEQIWDKKGTDETEDAKDKEEEEVEEEENATTFQDEDVAKALDIIVQWSKQFDLSVQLHANVLKAFFYETKKDR